MKKKITASLLVGLLPLSLWASNTALIVPENHWSGFYLGGNLGAIWSEAPSTTTALAYVDALGGFNNNASITYRNDHSAFMGGGQVGYNWQRNHFVLGTELSFDGMTLTNTHRLVGDNFPPPFVDADDFTAKVDWQAAWVARVGTEIRQNWLVYAVGGVALTQAKVSALFVPFTLAQPLNIPPSIDFPPSVGSQSRTLVGGTVGAGFEYALSPHLHAGLEYRYSGYGSQNYNGGTVAADAVLFPIYDYTGVSTKMNLSTNQLLFKLNYQFNA